MKFRFCGDADCPDWVLAEITTLSRLSSVKLKILGQLVAKSIVEPPFDIEKAEKILSDSKLDPDVDLKTCIACLNFILTSATSFNCDQGIFSNELQQLGFPREHSQSIRKVYIDHCDVVSASLRAKSLRVNRLEGITIEKNPEVCTVNLELTIAGTKSELSMPEKLAEQMLKEMYILRNMMQEVTLIDHAL